MSRPALDPPVSVVMTRDVLAMGPQTGLQAAMRLLAEHNISGAPVVTSDGRAVGFVSLTDLAGVDDGGAEPAPGAAESDALATDGWTAEESGEGEILDAFVEDVMTRDVYSIDEESLVSEAAKIMVQRRVHRLLVTSDMQLVGIVSTLDLLRGLVGEPETEIIEALELETA